MQVIEIDLPFKVSSNLIYSGKHWSERAKLKDQMIWAMFGLKKLKAVDVCEIEFEFKFKKNPLDCDNCSYLSKMILDCLVHYKILKDDNYKIVNKISLSSEKGDKDSVKITIKEKE